MSRFCLFSIPQSFHTRRSIQAQPAEGRLGPSDNDGDDDDDGDNDDDKYYCSVVAISKPDKIPVKHIFQNFILSYGYKFIRITPICGLLVDVEGLV